MHAEVAYDKKLRLSVLQGFLVNFNQNGGFSGLCVLIMGIKMAVVSHFCHFNLQNIFRISNFRQINAYFQGVTVVRQLFSKIEEVPLW